MTIDFLQEQIEQLRAEVAELRARISDEPPERVVSFRNSTYNDTAKAAQALKHHGEGVNVGHYRQAILDWSETARKRRTDAGWLATYRQWIQKDAKSGKLVRTSGSQWVAR